MDAKPMHDLRSWLRSLSILIPLIEEKFDFESERGQLLLAQAKEAGKKMEKVIDKMKAEPEQR